jgi:hypothetical protein
VTGSLCGSSASHDVNVAIPTNYHLEEWWDIGGGVIKNYYEWDSTSGNLEDLDGCDVGELVCYPNGNPYVPPDPPFDNWVLENPTEDWNPPTWPDLYNGPYGCVFDNNGKGGFSEPYLAVGFSAGQYARWRDCTGTPTDFWGPVTISREVYYLGGNWYYEITKDVASAMTIILP